MRRFPRTLIAFLAVCSVLAGSVRGETSVDGVKSALEALHAWVGSSDNGMAWKRFLKSDDLVALVHSADAVDAAQIQEILRIYASDTPGLERRQFTAVREALQRWVDELSQPTPAVQVSLPELIRGAKGQARLITPDEVAQAKARLLEDMQALDTFLSSGPIENAESWRGYLGWTELQEELAKETPSPGVLNRLLFPFTGTRLERIDNRRAVLAVAREKDAEGNVKLPRVEGPRFTQVREALRQYRDLVWYASSDELQQFDAKVEELAALAETYGAGSPSSDSYRLGRLLGWFERTQQLGDMTSAIRERHSHPNLFVSASARLVNSSIERALHQSQRVRDTILGTAINANSTLKGQLGTTLVPNPTRATFDITLVGNAYSSSVGYNSGLAIHSTGVSRVHASKRVYFDEDGFLAEGAGASAPTSTNIHNITGRGPLARKIAWKRVGGSKAQAERIASGRAASRVASGLNSQANEQLAKANESIVESYLRVLRQRDSLPQLTATSTTSTEMLIKMLRATMNDERAQIAAAGPPPTLAGDFDLSARVHQSIVANFAESLLGGVILKDTEIEDLYRLRNPDAPIPSDLDTTIEENAPWAITFSSTRPITAEFDGGGVRITVRCRYLHQSQETGKYPIRDLKFKGIDPEIWITRDYTLTTPNGGVQLVAKSDIQVDFMIDDQPIDFKGPLLHIPAGTFLQKKFDDMLTDKIPAEDSDGLVLPIGTRRIKLASRTAESSGGWLSIGWEQTEVYEAPEEETQVAASSDDVQPEPTSTASLAP